MKRVSIILPVYNGEAYLEKLINEIRNQKTNHEIEIIAAVSKSDDNSFELAKSICDIVYHVNSFNHALTRHEAALKSTGEILVFITQDVIPYNSDWLNNLISPLIESNNIVATYSRQIAYPHASFREKLIRKFNYPNYNRLCNSTTKSKWGRKNIFYSDTSSATLREEFLNLNGYNFKANTNEDVLYALKVINSGKSVLYNSNSIVYHSHDFNLKNNFNRYKSIGEFERLYSTELHEYSSIGEGKALLKYLVINLIKYKKFNELLLLIFDLGVRYVAYKKGYSINKGGAMK